MEIFELQYFLAVAQSENIHRASEKLNVSPGSLSKAISRLEEELGVSLFFKQGRNIRISPEGANLKKRASLIVQLEEDARIELGGQKDTFKVVISAEEILHFNFGIKLMDQIQKQFNQSRFQFLVHSDSKVIKQVLDDEAHFGITTGDVPKSLKSKVLSKVEFKTTVSSKHPLFKKYTHSSKIPVEEILKHSFVSPESSLFGKISKSSSSDGWRDDQFPRIIRYRVSSLKILEKLLLKGEAIAYLPDFYVQELNLIPLIVTGCPYSCHQSVKLICKNPESLGWMNRIWTNVD